MMPSEELLNRYARSLLTDALVLQRGQNLLLRSEPIHRPFLERIEAIAQELGVGDVKVYYYDRKQQRERIDTETVEQLQEIDPELKAQGDWITATRGASLYIDGQENPAVFEGADPDKLNALERSRLQALKTFYDAIMHSTLQWTLACAPTVKWAERVYPELSGSAALEKFWDTLLRINAVGDGRDPAAYWNSYGDVLEVRAQKLNAYRFGALEFRGPNTNLRVGLSPSARWIAAKSTAANGIQFYANRPSFEIFTTPDWRQTEGHVALTLPALINDMTVEGASFTFSKGRVVDFSSKNGDEILKSFLKTDTGASQLGEIALVGMDTPLSQEERVFYSTLLDENARCHFAFGRGYGEPIEGYNSMTAQQHDELGVNDSDTHKDVMISDGNTDVDGITTDGTKVAIMRSGLFVI